MESLRGYVMRQWAYLRKPYNTNKKDMVYKIMIHEMKKCTMVYLYCAKEAIMCSYDNWYPDLESALEDWQSEIDSEGWHVIEETLPDCQDDCIEPIRVKGRDKNNPQWGKYEILKDGVWVDYVV